jgi:leucyl-tRNA synthetase
MKVGPYAGRKVSEAKAIIKERLVASGQALPYSEPEKVVSSRASFAAWAPPAEKIQF